LVSKQQPPEIILKEGLFNMKTETKVNIYNSLFISILFGVSFTILGGLILSGSIDWENFPAEAIFGVAVSFAIGMAIPGGKWGFALASKVAKPGSLLFSFIMYTIILAIMLTLMCPILTLFIGCVIMGAPLAAMLNIRSMFSLYIPFYGIAIIILMLCGNLLMKLAMKCAGVPPAPPAEPAEKA
jgi:hypothetical protein